MPSSRVRGSRKGGPVCPPPADRQAGRDNAVVAPQARVFLLSPANCGGTRARQALSPKATFALAEQLRSSQGAMLGDVFAFVSAVIAAIVAVALVPLLVLYWLGSLLGRGLL